MPPPELASEATPEAVGESIRTNWSRVAFGVGLSAFVAYQQFKLPPVLPGFLAEHPHDPIVAAGFMSIYALVGLLASAAIGGWLVPARWKRGVVLVLVLSAAGLALALAVPDSAAVMLSARGLEGLAFAFGAIAGPAIAGSAASPRDLPIVTGLLAGWIPIGQILAALLALQFSDWRALWLAGLLLIPLLGLWAKLTLTPEAAKAGQRNGAKTALARGEIVALALTAAIFLLWSNQYFAFMTWLTQYLTQELHLGSDQAVLAYLLPIVVLLTCNLLTGWAIRHGLQLMPALILGLLLQIAVWLAVPILDGWIGIVALVLYGIAAGIIPTCLFHLPHHILKRTAGANAFGIVMTGRNIGVLSGPILLAALVRWTGGWIAASYVIAALTMLAAITAILLWKMERRARTE
jgi:predicted MFS family arabinose efflux permease